MAVLGIFSTFPIPYKRCTENLFYPRLLLLCIIYLSPLLRSCPLKHAMFSAVCNSSLSEGAGVLSASTCCFAHQLPVHFLIFVSLQRFLLTSGSLPGILIPNRLPAHRKGILVTVNFAVFFLFPNQTDLILEILKITFKLSKCGKHGFMGRSTEDSITLHKCLNEE